MTMSENLDPYTYWENRSSAGRTWSGNVNAALEREVGEIAPGTALDLGSGEGGDALWLERRGWSVTAVDISPSAIETGRADQQPDDDITWVVADLTEWQPPAMYDLVTACFLHSSVGGLPREAILRRVAAAVAPGGHLLVVGHAGVPPWAGHDAAGQDAAARHHAAVELPTPEEVRAQLFEAGVGLDESEWTVVTSALVPRLATAPDGSTAPIDDSVLMLRRAG